MARVYAGILGGAVVEQATRFYAGILGGGVSASVEEEAAAGTQFFLPDARFEMPELLVPGKKPISHAVKTIEQKLLFGYLFRGDIVPSFGIDVQFADRTAGGVAAKYGNVFGMPTWYNDGTSNDWVQLPALDNAYIQRSHTLVFDFVLYSQTETTNRAILTKGEYWGGISKFYYALHKRRSNHTPDGNKLQFEMHDTSSSIDVKSSSAVTFGSRLKVVVRVDWSGSLAMWVNGDKTTGGALSSLTAGNFNDSMDFLLAAYDNDKTNYNGKFDTLSLQWYDGALADGLCYALSLNPYRLIVPA